MANVYAEFFSAYRAQPEFNTERETAILESYLDGNLTVDEAVDQIIAPSSDRRQPANTRVGKTWELFLAAGEQLEDAQAPILELIQAIFARPKPEGNNTADVDWSKEKQSQGLGWTWEGAHGSLASDIQTQTSSRATSTLDLQHRWANFHAFTARAESTGIMYSNLSWAISLFVSTLERKITTKDKKSKDVWLLETNVPAVANWFIFAAKEVLAGGAQIGKENFETSESREWKDKGFSKERWNFWKSNLVELSTSDLLSEDAQQAARKAVVSIEKAERAKK